MKRSKELFSRENIALMVDCADPKVFIESYLDKLQNYVLCNSSGLNILTKQINLLASSLL